MLLIFSAFYEHSGYDDVRCVEGEEEKNIIDFQETTLLINQAS